MNDFERVASVIRYLDKHQTEQPGLADLAASIGLSPFHFHRQFTELLGLTPKHLLLECQIAEAKMHLMSREKELAQIATDCGFAHQSHFTSRFKQATGLTPTRWRRLATERMKG